jgi:hypothetical protein
MSMPVARRDGWTLADVDRLVDDREGLSPRYELVGGELLVTPAPTGRHQRIILRLAFVLQPYLSRHGSGEVVLGSARLQLVSGERYEPDLFVVPSIDGRTPPADAARVPCSLLEQVDLTLRRAAAGRQARLRTATSSPRQAAHAPSRTRAKPHTRQAAHAPSRPRSSARALAVLPILPGNTATARAPGPGPSRRCLRACARIRVGLDRGTGCGRMVCARAETASHADTRTQCVVRRFE